jgi:ribosomal protein S18 acetylase RimI-like enzyme
MVGAVICYPEPYGGYVDQLAVRRPWRRRGLGSLLLLTAFAALRERGCPEAVLGVDSDNPSGAVGLYERLGMRRSTTHDFYEKVLRDGR